MKDTDKARYFCYTHPNLFSQKRCSSCGGGMCYTCINKHETLCSDCQRSIYRVSDAYAYKKEGLWMLGTGVLTLSLFLAYYHITETQIIYSQTDVLLAFLFGSNVIASYYFLSKTTIVKEVNKVPFIGFKLALIVLVLIFITGLPLLYFLVNYISTLLKNKA
jgi:hypothetical protein